LCTQESHREEETMAQADRRIQHDLSASSSETTEAAKKLMSAAATGGDALMDGQAELLAQVDQMSKRWLAGQRQAIDATRRSLVEMQHCRDFADVMRVQQEWMATWWQRFASDFEALSTMALDNSQRAMMWAGEAAGEQARRGEQVMLSTAGAKPRGGSPGK
jgi:hypothetical protein